MGKIVRLEVTNFKSYKDKHVIGPFKDFTAIIGPNGAGKSSILDAIGFVFGVQSKTLRSQNLKELIYNSDNMAKELSRKASVSLFLEHDSTESSHLEFCRKITPDGSSKYYVQRKLVSWDQYNKTLKSFNILVKAKNFLVFQGDIISIASLNSKERTVLFEQISGSIEYKEEYEELLGKRESAEIAEELNAKEKKEIQKERKQVQEQQKVGEEYHRLKQKIMDLNMDYFLFKLYNVKSDIETIKSRQEEKTSEMLELQNKAANSSEELNNLKSQLAKEIDLKKSIQQKIRVALSKLREERGNLQSVTDEESHRKNKINEYRKEEREIEIALKERSHEKETFMQRITKLEKAISDLQKKNPQNNTSNNSFSKLSTSQRQELSAIRLRLEKDCSQQEDALSDLKSSKQSREEQLQLVDTKLSTLKGRMDELQKTKRNLVQEHDVCKQSLIKSDVSIQEQENQNELIRKEREELERNEEQIFKNVRKLKIKLEGFKMVKNKYDRERESQKVIKLLKTLHGVHGRLIDLIKPKGKQYEVSLNIAFGKKNLEMIVCENKEVARRAGLLLTERRIRSRCFLPLDTIKVRKSIASEQARLRYFSTSHAQSWKLACDVVEYDPAIEKAINFALGTTIICDSLKDAKEIVYGKNERNRTKAVTLDGEVITLDSMTGGILPSDSQNRFKDKDYHDTIDRLGEYDTQLISVRDKLQTLNLNIKDSGEIEKVKSEREYKEVHVASLAKDIERISRDINEISNEVEEMEQVKLTEKKEITKISEKCKEIELVLLQTKAKAISNFEREHNLQNIILSEESYIKEVNDFEISLNSLLEQKTKLEGRVKFYDTDQGQEKISRLKAQIKEELNLVTNVKKTSSILKSMVEKLDLEIQQLKSGLGEQDQSVKEKKTEIFEIKRRLEKQTAKKLKLEKQKTKFDNTLEKLRGERHEILNEALLNDVYLPTINGINLYHTESKSSLAASRSTAIVHGSESAMSSSQNSDDYVGTTKYDSTKLLTLGFSQDDGLVVRKENLLLDAIDFTKFLKRCEKKKMMELFHGKVISKVKQADREYIENIFHTMLKEDKEKASKLKPNTGAKEDLKDVCEKLKRNENDTKHSAQELDSIKFKFEHIKQKRLQVFMKMFNHVNNVIDSVYKDLTRSSQHDFGGNAYIRLEDRDEPWRGGVNFVTTPPNKRYRQMNQLSGGEKTVASLALLFSIHSFYPAPFFVLDEIDAALDNENLRMILNYIIQKQRVLQCIVISHKSLFYHKAEALIGVYKDQQEMSSGVLTFEPNVY